MSISLYAFIMQNNKYETLKDIKKDGFYYNTRTESIEYWILQITTDDYCKKDNAQKKAKNAQKKVKGGQNKKPSKLQDQLNVIETYQNPNDNKKLILDLPIYYINSFTESPDATLRDIIERYEIKHDFTFNLDNYRSLIQKICDSTFKE